LLPHSNRFCRPSRRLWVVAVEQQGHGHTADIDRPLTFEQMADDTAVLLRPLTIERADLFGAGAGGNVALQIAMRHPDLVHKRVVAATFSQNDGYYPEVLEGLKGLAPEGLPMKREEDDASAAPDPKQWPTRVAKVANQAAECEGWLPLRRDPGRVP
jgi:pimeloyl-ACP methyl ester carboxylesterase